MVYASVGRRLGHPLKLISAAGVKYGHLFVRWDGQGERFNVEATNKGVNCYPDDHYRTGFFQLPPGEEEYGCHLRPKMPREECRASWRIVGCAG